MTDIFFSYSSADRERVRPVRDALVAQGFEVFWDQEVPTGLDWDSWIRQHLAKCKCAMAFWSAASVASDNVRHEAMVAKQQGKLISVLLEPLTIQQFPMGLYVQQAANLAGWDGDTNHNEWRKLRREYEAKLIPTWVRQQLDELEAELVGERARREGVERRDKTLQAQIAKEAETQLGLQRERDSALDEIAALKGTVQELARARSEGEARETDTLQQVAALRATVDEVTRARSDAEQRLTKLRQTKAKEIARSISPFVIAAALVTLGVWTYQLVWPAPQPLPAVTSASISNLEAKLNAAEAQQQRLTDEIQGQAKAAAEAQTKLQDADTKRQAAEKAAADADSKRRTAEQQLAAKLEEEPKAAATARPSVVPATQPSPALPQPAPAATKGPFEIQRGVQAVRSTSNDWGDLLAVNTSAEECQQRCTQSAKCNAFTFNKVDKTCYSFSDAQLVPSTNFDSGVRQSASVGNKGPFAIKIDTEASGTYVYNRKTVTSITQCEQACREDAKCKIFAYNKIVDLTMTNSCFLYDNAKATLINNNKYDTGIRP